MKNKKWLQAVAEIGVCQLCGRYGVQVAHRNYGKGMGIKNPDHLTAALCPECHHEIDNGCTLSKEDRRSMMDRAIVNTFDELVKQGKIGVLK